MKHISWLAFKMVELDWMRVIDAWDILAVEFLFHFATRGNNETDQDSNWIQQYFSSEQEPTLWCTLPVLEHLQSA